jgi:hypothetical protein
VNVLIHFLILQIEENACLHDELTRLARLRENAEITDRLHPSATGQVGGLYGTSPGMYSPNVNVGGIPVSGTAGTSVLKSVDEILRDGHHHGHNDLSAYSHRTNHFPSSSSVSRYGGRPPTNNYDALYSMSGDLNLMSSTAGVMGGGAAPYHSDLYTGSTYDRVTDFSPINSEPPMGGARGHYDMNAYTSAAAGGVGVGGKYPNYASYK